METNITYKTDTVTTGVIYSALTKEVLKTGEFIIKNDKNNRLTLKNTQDGSIITCDKKDFDQGDPIPRRIRPSDIKKEQKENIKRIERTRRNKEIKKEKKITEEQLKKAIKQIEERKENLFPKKKQFFEIPTTKVIATVSDETPIINLINSGIKNIWLVGPAGCGKTTIAKNVARMLNKHFFLMSLGEGTSPSEFKGRHFPIKESVPFCDAYRKNSIITLDEFTTLIPETAQVLNASLANDFIYSTTGKVHRHKDCVIIATSNTFGVGSDAMYLANNALDASTIDRFTGGIVQINYSEKYESKFKKEVVEYINNVRTVISQNYLNRIASTRMIIAGEKLKKNGHKDWKERLIVNWTPEEQELVKVFEKEAKKAYLKKRREELEAIITGKKIENEKESDEVLYDQKKERNHEDRI